MPMFTLSFRFPEAAPEPEELLRWLEPEVGKAGIRHLEDLRSDGARLSVNAMSFVMLIYVAKVCLARGAVGLDILGKHDVPMVVPAWAQRPWVHYPWWQKLRISFGRLSLR